MQNIPHYHFSHAVMVEHPEIYKYIEKKLSDLKQSSRHDIASIPYIFNEFCQAHGMAPGEIRLERRRTPASLIEKRRLYIALILVQYDPLYMHDYSQCMKANLRRLMAEDMRVKPEWISQVIDSVRFEYYNLCTFRMQVDLLIYYLNNRRQVA